MDDIQNKIRNGVRPKFDFPILKAYQELIEKSWSQNPENSPTFDEITQELRTNPSFITDSINKETYQNYINYIDQNISNSLYNCGKMYYNGEIVSSNKRKAAFYFQKSAELKNIDSMVAYSIILFNGDGVPSDPATSLMYLKEAADKGSPEAMHIYSLRLGIGDGTCTRRNKRSCSLFQDLFRQGEKRIKMHLCFPFEGSKRRLC